MIQVPTSEMASLLTSPDLTLVLFTMAGCEPCENVKQALAELSSKDGLRMAEIRYVVGDVAGRSAMLRAGIRSYPTLLLIDNRAERARRDGASLPSDSTLLAEDLGRWIDQHRPSKGLFGRGWLRI